MTTKLEVASVVSPAEFEAPRTFIIQRWDNRNIVIKARSYYKTESTYVFTNITYSELKARWNRGTLMEVPPLLEMDVDAVVMIADDRAVPAKPRKAPRKPKPKKSG